MIIINDELQTFFFKLYENRHNPLSVQCGLHSVLQVPALIQDRIKPFKVPAFEKESRCETHETQNSRRLVPSCDISKDTSGLDLKELHID